MNCTCKTHLLIDVTLLFPSTLLQQVTGRSFGEKDFRSGLENGILLCELLNAIKPGLVKKINRLPTPIAGLDNIILFLRGCKELGLKESQLFDPGDLQDTSNRVTIKNIDYSRKLKNVLVTIYWLGKAANSCTSYSGSTLNLKEFEGFLAQMRKETEDIESPKRSIRDSGYIDCWDSERSDSLSPPRHGRDDSFDSLDSFGSRSQQTPSPDVVLRGSSDGRGSDSETDLPHRKMPDVKKDDMLARRTSHGEPKSAVPFNQYLPNKSNQTFYVPAPLRKKKAEREEYRKSWSTATSPLGDRPFRFGPRTAVSDDAESMSMFDMRCEEEAVAQPHSKARHEKLQNIHNQLKEDETRWQDDLARWKSRRRSASQDLIKKEAERKKMERLLAGDGMSERRKSIKTYREIVEEKERRERELHEAYKNAKTQEEAESILQQYTERFTISEAVLERLQMPKILERSHSVEPNSPLKDPNPLRYLRQQSLPAPKFTATIEATIVPTTELEPSSSTGRTSPSKNVSKAVPMLTPKPYSQPKNTQEVLKNFKVDGKVSMNGENVNGMEEKDKECTTVIFTPSPTRSLKFDGVARGDKPPVELKKDPPSVELSLQRPATQSVHKEPTVRPTRTKQPYFLCQFSVIKAKALEEKGSVVLPFLKKLPETSQLNMGMWCSGRCRFNFWAWDPEEERKRQERWQHEQERLLQEKYQKEQCKLKEEWEKAQREEEVVFWLVFFFILSPLLAHLEGRHAGRFSNMAEGSMCIYENSSSAPSSPSVPLDTYQIFGFILASVAVFLEPCLFPRSVSGKKLCSTCGLPLGKGAAMIIETLGLYFHIQCFRCGVCKGQLGDAASGTDVRIRNGLLNCNDCYIRSRSKYQILGPPTIPWP
uniref:LIM and calponin homology domains 1 n=1 Tax=Catharus ustulatus TaxID=91951 RepID=A0A8C3TTY0_CATUS